MWLFHFAEPCYAFIQRAQSVVDHRVDFCLQHPSRSLPKNGGPVLAEVAETAEGAVTHTVNSGTAIVKCLDVCSTMFYSPAKCGHSARKLRSALDRIIIGFSTDSRKAPQRLNHNLKHRSSGCALSRMRGVCNSDIRTVDFRECVVVADVIYSIAYQSDLLQIMISALRSLA